MKKIILFMSVLAIANINAKSRSEMIREELSKLGISQGKNRQYGVRN